MRKIIRGGTVVNASESVNADVLIDGEAIAGVGSFDGVDAELIDATGCYVLPGAIDNHTHLSMPFGGTWSSDDYDTGTQAAAAGGTTCIVDFALQMHPGGLRSSLEEWMGRAEGAAHVDYGFHMAITHADDGDDRRHGGDRRRGRHELQGLPRLPERADGDRRSVPRGARACARPRRAHDGALRERLRDPAPRAEGAARPARPTRSTTRSRAPRRWRPRPPGAPLRLARFAGAPLFVVHVSCRLAAEEIIARPRARARRLRRDLHPVPLQLDRRPPPPRLRGRALRLLAAAARRLQPAASLGRAAPRPPADRLDRPLPLRRPAEAPRAGRLLEDPERPRGDPAPAADALGARRARGAAVDEPASWRSPRRLSPRCSGCTRARA